MKEEINPRMKNIYPRDSSDISNINGEKNNKNSFFPEEIRKKIEDVEVKPYI